MIRNIIAFAVTLASACIVAKADTPIVDPYVIPAGTKVYEDCLLSELPGTANDAAAYAILRMCKEKFPRDEFSVPEKRHGYFDYSSASECAAKKGKDTASRAAGNFIVASCNKLY